ncbi:S8 family serine peptidase [Candidatus Pacearchaeota archaeon]|nr:S8 family serine peptidase [Candidatus Pacearchaeota archaeon]
MKRGNKSFVVSVIIILIIILISQAYLLIAQNSDSNEKPLFQPSPNSYDGYIIELNNPSILEKINDLNQTAYNNQKEIDEMSDLNPIKYWKIYFDLKPEDVPKKINDYKTDIIDNKESVKNKIKNKLKKDKVSYITGNAIVNPQVELVIKEEFENVLNGIAVQITDEEAEILKSLPEIKSIQPNFYVEIDLMDSVDQINANYSWINGYMGEGTTIAILDTGIDYTHPDLGGCFGIGCKVVGGYDFINNDENPTDDHGHGTHCAGTAAGNGSLKGVAPGAKLYAYKVLAANGRGAWSVIISGINRAVDPNNDGNFSDHVDVISMSLGADCKKYYGGYYSNCGPNDAGSTAVDNAVNMGVIVVVAAGNSGTSGASSIWTPGTARKAITVGAVTKSNTMAYFSSKGPVIYNNEDIEKPDVVAPGVNICASKYGGPISYGCFDTRHVYMSGTSMATPHVAGMAALLVQKYPEYNPDEIESLMKNTSDYLPAYTVNDQGYGLINIQKAMNVSDLTKPISHRLPLEFYNDQLLSYSIEPDNKAIFQINKTLFIVTKKENSIFYSKLNTNGEIITYMDRISYDIFNQNNPSLVVINNIPHVVWNDDRNFNNEIYYKIITNSSAVEKRITFSGFESIKPQIIDQEDSIGIIFLKLTDGLYNLNYKKLDFNENILLEDLEIIQDIDDFNAIYYKDNIYISTKDSQDNIKLLKINKEGILQDTIDVATGTNPDLSKYDDYETRVIWIDTSNNLHVAIVDDYLKSIIDDKTFSGTLNNPIIRTDELNFTYIFYESIIDVNNIISYSVISPNNTIMIENKEVTNQDDNSINPIITIGSLNLLYENNNQLKLMSTDLKYSSPPRLIYNKITSLNAYGAVFEFNYDRLIKISTLTIKDKDSTIVATIINNTITSIPTFSTDNLTSGSKFFIEIDSIDLVGNPAHHSTGSELNNTEFYTRTTSKIPELPTSLYGRVITTDDDPVEGIQVSAKWTDVDDDNFTSLITTFSREEAIELGDESLAGYFRFNTGNIKAKKSSLISVSAPKDISDPDPFVTASPGKRAIEINEPILISGEPPELTINSPLEQIYTSDELPLMLNYNASKALIKAVFRLNNQLNPDINRDGIVDFGDYLILEEGMGEENCKTPYWCDKSDINRDGIVDFGDYLILEAGMGEMISEVNILGKENTDINISPIIGENTITIDVIDITKVGNSKTISFTIQDISSPEVTLNNPIYSQDSIRLSAIVVDTISPLKHNCMVCITTDGYCDTEWQSATNEIVDNSMGGICSFTIDKTSYNEGDYSFNFKISDIYDNEDYGELSLFTIDNTPPTQLPQLTVAPVQSENALLISWTPTSDSNFKEYRIYRSSSPEELIKVITNKSQYDFKDTNLEENKVYKYRMTVVDDYGNENQGKNSSEKVPDITVPTITITSPENYKLYNYKNITLSYTVSEQSNCSLNLNSNFIPITSSINAIEGLNTLQISCDDGENIGYSQELSFTVDTIPPIKVTPGVYQRPGQKILDVYWSSSQDSEKFYVYKSNQNFTNVNEASLIATTYSSMITDTNNIIEGNTYYYAILPEDATGNINNEFDIVTKTVSDVTSPIVTLISPFNTIYNTSEIILIFETSEDVKECVYNLDNFIFTANKYDLINVSDGNHNIQVTCIDYDDNSGDSQLVSFTVDTMPPDNIAPIITLISPANTVYNTNIIPLIFNSSEEVINCVYILDNYVYQATNNQNISASNGSHSIKVNCTDLKFNQGDSQTVSFTVNIIPTNETNQTIPPPTNETNQTIPPENQTDPPTPPPQEPFTLTITNPKNNDIFNFTKIPVSYTSDTELESCEYILENDQISSGLLGSTEWIKYFPNDHIFNNAEVADIDNDGDLEIIVGVGGYSNSDLKIYAWHHDGTIVDGWPIDTITSPVSTPAIADIDNDGDLEIFIGTLDKFLHAWHHDGTIVSGWPKEVIKPGSNINAKLTIDSSPSIGDIDNDGDLEILIGIRQDNLDTNTYAFAWHHDGTLVNNWPITIPSKPTNTYSNQVKSTLSLADLDNNNDLEIILGTTYNQYVYNHDGTLFDGNNDGTPDWPQNICLKSDCGSALEPRFARTASIGDIDNNGDFEFVVATKYHETDASDGRKSSIIHVFNPDGSEIPGFPLELPDNTEVFYSSHPTADAPVLADIDNDGFIEILFFAITQQGNIDCYSAGNDHPGSLMILNHDGSYYWDRDFKKLIDDEGYLYRGSAPIVLDIDNDNDMEILISAGWIPCPTDPQSRRGKLFGWHHDGTPITGFPKTLDSSSYQSKPIIEDIDNDGDIEIIGASRFYGNTPQGYVEDSHIYVMDLPNTYNPNDIEWNHFSNNLRNTGVYGIFSDTEICSQPGDEDNNGLADCLDPACPESTICSKNNAKSCQSGTCEYRQGLPFDTEVDAFEGKNELTLICEATDTNKSSSNMVTFFIDTQLPDTNPPLPIQNLQLTKFENQNTVKLTWNSSNEIDFANYNIYRSQTHFDNTDGMVTIAKTTNNYFNDTNIEPGEYYYAVSAVDENLNENKSVNSIYINITQQDSIPPTIIMNLSKQSPVYGIVNIQASAFDNIGLSQTCQVCISSDGGCDTEWVSTEYNYNYGDKSGTCSYNWDTTNFNKTRYTVIIRVSDLSNNYGYSEMKLIDVIDEPIDPICIDLEGIQNHSLKGIVNMTYGNGDNQIFTDSCIQGKQPCYFCENQTGAGLNEYFCENQTSYEYESLICDYGCDDGACIIPLKCSDDTIDQTCSAITKPKFCNNTQLIDKCSECGCDNGYYCNLTTESCEEEPPPEENNTCSDGTPYGACSSNQPQFCAYGYLVDDCNACGCEGENICNNDSNSCELPPPPEIEIPLYAGWNLISIPKIPTDSSISTILEPISGKYDSVYSYDPISKNWLVYRENASIFDSSNNLGNMYNAKAYWIDMIQDTTLIINGSDQTSYSTSLSQGWNFIGYPYTYEKSIEETFSSLNNKFDIIYTYNNQYKTWNFYSPYESIYDNSINNTVPNKGYWIYLYESSTWTP